MFGKELQINATGSLDMSPSNKVAANTFAEAIAEANGAKINQAPAVTIDHRQLPKSFTVEVVSPADAQADDIEVALFNEDVLEETPTNNDLATGTDGGTVTVTYGDGRQGKVYNRLLQNYGGGRGVIVKEITMSVTNNAAGTANETEFNTCDMGIFTPTGKGTKEMPYSINWDEVASNSPNKSGIYTIKTNFRLHSLNQIRYTQSPDTKYNLVLKLDLENS